MKRVCSLCLSLVLAFVLTCPALAAVTATEPEIAAAYLKERGIMVGAEDGDMMLDSGLTRTELAVLLARITVKPEYLEAEQKLYIRACRFTDVPRTGRKFMLVSATITASWQVMAVGSLEQETQSPRRLDALWFCGTSVTPKAIGIIPLPAANW